MNIFNKNNIIFILILNFINIHDINTFIINNLSIYDKKYFFIKNNIILNENISSLIFEKKFKNLNIIDYL